MAPPRLAPLCASAVLATSAFALQQSPDPGRLRTAPVQAPAVHRGTYHVATGTWSRGNGGFLAGPERVYNNNAPSGYFATMDPGERAIDEGRIPSLDSQGTSNVYTVNGFEIGYCTDEAVPISIEASFYEQYQPCTMPGSPTAQVLLSGLPGSGSGLLSCWIISIDLEGSSFEFALTGDGGDATWNGDPNLDSFGYGLRISGHTGTQTGLLISGDPNNAPFGDGTTFPGSGWAPPPAQGTGLDQQDLFWYEDPFGGPLGCFFFGGYPGAPWGGFHLQLDADTGQLPFSVTQLSYVDGSGVPFAPFSDYGQFHLTLPALTAGEIQWVNAVVDGVWAIQNAPLIEIEGAGEHQTTTYDFRITPVSGTPVGSVQVVFEAGPSPLVSPPVGAAVTVPVTQHDYHTGATLVSPTLTQTPYAPPPAQNFVAGNGTTWSSVTQHGYDGINEASEHCTPGGFARVLDWMNRFYCLELPNGNSTIQQIYDKLRNDQHMMTDMVDGTIFASRSSATGPWSSGEATSKLVSGLKKFLEDKELDDRLAFKLEAFKSQDDMNPEFTPCDVFEALQAGKGVTVMWGYWDDEDSVDNGDRNGGHTITVVGAVKCDDEVTIFYRDDANGGDSQGDGQADRGVRTAKFKPGGASGWTLQGNRWEGFTVVCPTIQTTFNALLKWFLKALDGTLEVDGDLAGGMVPNAKTLKEIQEAAQGLVDASCFLIPAAAEIEDDCPGILSLAERLKEKAIVLRALSRFLREDPTQDMVNQMLALLQQIEDQLDVVQVLLDLWSGPFTAYCPGIGCPCLNDDPAAGCANSTGLGATLTANGSNSVGADDLSLVLANIQAGQFGVVFVGTTAINFPFGDGLRCVGGSIIRYPVRQAGATGSFVEGPGMASFAGIQAGDTRYFQGWYRDPSGPCGSAFNLSQALSTTFQP